MSQEKLGLGTVPDEKLTSSNSNTGEDDDQLTCRPILTLDDLLNYDPDLDPMTSEIRAQTKGYFPGLRSTTTKWCPVTQGTKASKDCPKLLVCHDLKGNYGDDRFIHGTQNWKNYTFRHWAQTDIFVYFAHKLVSIPPVGWINAAHSHGVKILGTFITEWSEGELICKDLLQTPGQIETIVQKLVQLTQDLQFDGYLVNIENKVEKDQIPQLLDFVTRLTSDLKKSSSHNLVIWYDSVIWDDGSLQWQDELNHRNKPFFDACDGIFLNYCWTDEKLARSLTLAGARKYDVFTGVDVFGRGCFGGGGLNTCQAIKKISNHNLSVALFAPAWTYECHPTSQFPMIDDQVWNSCFSYLTYNCVQVPPNLGLDDPKVKSTLAQLVAFKKFGPSSSTSVEDALKLQSQIILQTDFSRGYGQKSFEFGKIIDQSPWFNLSRQSFQPLIIHPTCILGQGQGQNQLNPDESVVLRNVQGSNIIYDPSTGFFGGGSLKVTNPSLKNWTHQDSDRGAQSEKEFPVVTSTKCPLELEGSSYLFIPMTLNFDEMMTMAVILIWKFDQISSSSQQKLNLSLITEVDDDLDLDGAGKVLKTQQWSTFDMTETFKENERAEPKKLTETLEIHLDFKSFLDKKVEETDSQAQTPIIFKFWKNRTTSHVELGEWTATCILIPREKLNFNKITSLAIWTNPTTESDTESPSFLGYLLIAKFQESNEQTNSNS